MTFDLARGSEPEVEKIVDEVEGTGKIEADKDEVELEEGVLSEGRFRRGGLDLLHSVAYQSIDLHQSIEDSYRREEYAREHAHIVEKFNKKWQKKELVRPLIPTTFPDEIRPKENLMYKKGGSRRRAYTGREAAEARETEQRRTRRRDSIEQGRRLRYNRLRAGGDDEVEGETEGKIHDVAKLLRSGRLILGTIGLGENLVMERIENASIVSDDDDEVQYISTQPILGCSMDPMLPSDDDNDVILTSEASSDSLEDIDDVLAKHSQKALPQAAPPSSLYRLSQIVRASQILPTSSATTRRSRGVAKKSKAQLELESQQRVEKSIKQAGAQARKETAMREVAKTMKPRKDNVSQLADEFLELKSSQSVDL